MVDITKYPYFSYNQIVKSVLTPINNQADIQLNTFSRIYPNREKFLIVITHEPVVDYYSSELYRYGLFEKKPEDYESSFNMWDHLPCDPHGIYEMARVQHGIAHGLTITQQQGTHLDVFVFTTKPGNAQVNNFYLNQRHLFTNFMEDFYDTLAPTLVGLAQHKFSCPGNTGQDQDPIKDLSPRQQDCALLMSAGLSVKEIARILEVSPRTVEEHITVLRTTFEAKNCTHLLDRLKKYIKEI